MNRQAWAFLVFLATILLGLATGWQYELVIASERRSERAGVTTVEHVR